MRVSLAPLRGFFSGDLRGQVDKLRLLARHGFRYRQLDRATVGFRYTLALLFAHRLGMLDALQRGSHDPASIADTVGIDARAAEILLRAMEAQGIVRRDGNRFSLSDFGHAFVVGDGSLSYGPMWELMSAYASGLDGIVEAMRARQAAAAFDVFASETTADAFLAAVNRYIDNVGRELLATIEMPKIRTFICGSMGISMSALVLDRHADARVTYGCLPHLIARAPRLIERYGIESSRIDGIHAHGGDPYDDKWGVEAYDLVFLTKKMVLEPDRKIGEQFARKAFDVLNPGGIAIFWEAVHEDRGATPLVRALESVLDLGICPTGEMLTRSGMTARLRDIGYRDIDIVPCLAGQTTFVVARRPLV